MTSRLSQVIDRALFSPPGHSAINGRWGLLLRSRATNGHVEAVALNNALQRDASEWSSLWYVAKDIDCQGWDLLL